MKCMLILAALAFSFNSYSAETLKDIELIWKPTSDLSDITKLDLSKISQNKFKIAAITDERTIKPLTHVGEYNEDAPKILNVDTKSNVTDYVTQNLKNTLSKVGLDIVEAGEGYVLSGQLKEFYVTENKTYKANITIKFNLKKGDKVVWPGPITGNNTRFGRTYKLENYLESYSDALLDATKNLISNESFRKQFN